jgi:nicotinamidase-related amidase
MLRVMCDSPTIFRSSELMSRGDTALVVIDAQEKLIPAVVASARVVWNIRRLIDAAKILGLPVVASEQYPQGLGGTVAELASLLPERPAKKMFSCRELAGPFEDLRQRQIYKLLLCGIETHVCVQQTALDLMTDGWRIYIPVDGVSARSDIDHQTALRRMESSGAVLTTSEAALFEWCETAATPEFKQISQLVREVPPRG